MRTWDARLENAILRAALAVAQHWLLVANLALAVFVTLPLLAPLLMAGGNTGAAGAIYSAYRITCHQEPSRSYFLAGPHVTYAEDQVSALTTTRPLSAFVGSPETGYKVAYCERDLATYVLMLVSSLLFAAVGRRLPRLPLRFYALMLAPLAIDETTQLLSLRESTWLLRTLTGGIFGVATSWLLLPELDQVMREAAHGLARRLGHTPS